jgi:hypothetical protein
MTTTILFIDGPRRGQVEIRSDHVPLVIRVASMVARIPMSVYAENQPPQYNERLHTYICRGRVQLETTSFQIFSLETHKPQSEMPGGACVERLLEMYKTVAYKTIL